VINLNLQGSVGDRSLGNSFIFSMSCTIDQRLDTVITRSAGIAFNMYRDIPLKIRGNIGKNSCISRTRKVRKQANQLTKVIFHRVSRLKNVQQITHTIGLLFRADARS
jgi:hypothetical protein